MYYSENKSRLKSNYMGVFLFTSSFTIVVMWYSFKVLSLTWLGESTTVSIPDWFLGNAMTSLMLVLPISIVHNLSNPNAKPA